MRTACSRENSVARGVLILATLTTPMTLDTQTFRNIFRDEVSEDLLDNTERMIVDGSPEFLSTDYAESA
jgi:hypothetical protein